MDIKDLTPESVIANEFALKMELCKLKVDYFIQEFVKIEDRDIKRTPRSIVLVNLDILPSPYIYCFVFEWMNVIVAVWTIKITIFIV